MPILSYVEIVYVLFINNLLCLKQYFIVKLLVTSYFVTVPVYWLGSFCCFRLQINWGCFTCTYLTTWLLDLTDIDYMTYFSFLFPTVLWPWKFTSTLQQQPLLFYSVSDPTQLLNQPTNTSVQMESNVFNLKSCGNIIKVLFPIKKQAIIIDSNTSINIFKIIYSEVYSCFTYSYGFKRPVGLLVTVYVAKTLDSSKEVKE